MAPRKRNKLDGAVVELAVPQKRGHVRVLMQVAETLRDPGARGLHRVIVFKGEPRTEIKEVRPAEIAAREVLFVVCFAVNLHVKRGFARVVSEAPVRELVRELAPRELWNMALIATAVRLGWKAGDDYDLLFQDE